MNDDVGACQWLRAELVPPVFRPKLYSKVLQTNCAVLSNPLDLDWEGIVKRKLFLTYAHCLVCLLLVISFVDSGHYHHDDSMKKPALKFRSSCLLAVGVCPLAGFISLRLYKQEATMRSIP